MEKKKIAEYKNGTLTYCEATEEEIARLNYPMPKEFEIKMLQDKLYETDWKISKSSEYFMCGLPLPYDIQALHNEKQALRDRINALEELDS